MDEHFKIKINKALEGFCFAERRIAQKQIEAIIEEQVAKTVGLVWAEACTDTDNNQNICNRDIASLLEKVFLLLGHKENPLQENPKTS